MPALLHAYNTASRHTPWLRFCFSRGALSAWLEQTIFEEKADCCARRVAGTAFADSVRAPRAPRGPTPLLARLAPVVPLPLTATAPLFYPQILSITLYINPVMADPPEARIPPVPELENEVWLALLTHESVRTPRITTLTDADGDLVNIAGFPKMGEDILILFSHEICVHLHLSPEQMRVCTETNALFAVALTYLPLDCSLGRQR